MVLKLAVAGADFLAAAGGWALVALAQPAASATGTAIAASVIASRRDHETCPGPLRFHSALAAGS